MIVATATSNTSTTATAATLRLRLHLVYLAHSLALGPHLYHDQHSGDVHCPLQDCEHGLLACPCPFRLQNLAASHHVCLVSWVFG
eukprot:CAMPEP_0185905816 /NCGR_PEP_ID=MMETSP0196C-20130402/4979_1 /TAXON_ID=2932 /ORGANISM="Alexandrium fundyense, Strain CCMP1719" /LENGTH=84 /DNA_ID=CAMNT_0028625419 /DNA_START=48 /DNA_END=298 /DNA_ORIENTATION=-